MFPWLMIQHLTMPKLPIDYDLPPTIYAILNSIVNYGKENKVKINQLPKFGRTKIFDFSYPLSSHISKEEFETMILKHYMMRRIGFETMTSFKLALDVKLNEIMPTYNMMFDSILDWKLFEDGEKTIRETIDSRTSKQETVESNESVATNDTTTTTKLTNETIDQTIIDSRNSDTPENQLNDVQSGSYVSQYTYDKNNGNSNSSSDGLTTNEVDSTNKFDSTNKVDSTDNGRVNETITRTPSDKMAIYKNFLESKQNIYTMIFKDLDSLFYQIV